ncbi:pentapeptide repeat-containing protein, partial [uncultured Megasphaera sp.]|uniref:pentapeptide repeat-containing protein n=1 Tax=uncultured Megasphaera sp. TaxID=165188 RepID=UPI002593B20F
FDYVNFNGTILECSLFKQCNISDSNFAFANLRNVDFTCTALDNVNFAYSNLYKVDFSAAIIKNIHVARAIPINIFGQKVICTQVNTSRRNNLISYWADLGIWTTGCFQGTLEELKEKVAKTHKNNPFLRERYERAINYILEEDKADKEKEQKNRRKEK